MATTQKPRIKRNSKKNTNNIERKGSGWYLFKNHKNCDLMLPKPTLNGTTIVPYNKTWEGDDYYFILIRSNLAQLVKKLSDEVPVLSQDKLTLLIDQPFTENIEKSEKNIGKTLSTINEFPEKSDFPNQENKTNQEILEKTKETETMSEKLLLDQAPCITNQGTIEQVVVEPEEAGIVMLDNFKPEKNKKNQKKQKVNEVLFNDSPIEGIQILN